MVALYVTSEGEFYKTAFNLLLDYLDLILGSAFTTNMVKKVLSNHVNENKKIWKKKVNLPEKMRVCVE